ncbi:ParA family protein [Nonomuraea sp. NPDC050310]|uniref:ParA family protein n=1 Tax=Nonomuraea sp. NPDC050310 TaxID=3154935 RepID=UPI0033E54496
MTQILAVYSESGGVTKTTSAVSLAMAGARDGRKVLLIDLDPRGAATKWVGVDPVEPGLHVGAILGNDDPEGWAAQLAVPSGENWSDNLTMIPSNREVANREKAADDHADTRLKASLRGIDADLVVLDCPNRQGGLITQNALTAADTVVYAAKPNEDGLDGVDGAVLTVRRFKAHRQALGARVELQEAGIIVGAAVRGSVWTRDALRAIAELRQAHPGLVLEPFVPDRVTVLESRSAGTFYGDYEGGKGTFEAYRQLARKVLR